MVILFLTFGLFPTTSDGLALNLIRGMHKQKVIIIGQILNISGCFKSESHEFPVLKRWTLEDLTESWMNVSAVEFQFKDQCTDQDDFQVIISNHVSENNLTHSRLHAPITTTEGARYRPAEVVLWAPQANGEHGRRRWRYVVIHEFGHVLGFAHEGRRIDSPEWCQHLTRRNHGGAVLNESYIRQLTPFDDMSIMSHCDLIWYDTYQKNLTESDIAGVRSVYGPRVEKQAMLPTAILAAATSLVALVTAIPPNTTCLPIHGICNSSACSENATGHWICPECCGDSLCLMDAAMETICVPRPISFARLCQLVSTAKNSNFNGSIVSNYTLSNGAKNCTIAIQGEPRFVEVCDHVSDESFKRIAFSTELTLYDKNNKNGTCNWEITT